MGPNTPEQNPPEKNMQQQAKEAADQIIQQIRDSYKSELIKISAEPDADKRTKMREEIAKEYEGKGEKYLPKAAEVYKMLKTEAGYKKAGDIYFK